MLKDLYNVAMAVKAANTVDKKNVLAEGLAKIKFPRRFQLPLDPRCVGFSLLCKSVCVCKERRGRKP